MELAGQIFGWLAALLTFLSYQCKGHKKLIAVQSFATMSICISYLFLGAWAGALLNFVCVLRNIIIYKKNVKIFSYSFWPYFLAIVMGIMGALSWQGSVSLLVIIALMINTMFLYFPNVQNLRKSILLTSSMIILYNLYYNVWGGVINEIIAITSALIGMYRYRKTE